MIISRSFRVLRIPLSRISASQSYAARLFTSQKRLESQSSGDNDKPFPFMSKYSENKYHSADTFHIADSAAWEYQPYVIALCLFVFSMYLMFRGENDMDDSLGEVLYAAMPEMEIRDLRNKIKKYKKMGLYTKHLEDRLHELSS